jgi:hypothetical protein
MAHDFTKAINYLDRMHHSQWQFHHFAEANRLAGNPFSDSSLKQLWDACAAAGSDQALMLGEVFRKKAGG